VLDSDKSKNGEMSPYCWNIENIFSSFGGIWKKRGTVIKRGIGYR
jgi:hypothetical protein